MLLLLDNQDSFVWNLAQALAILGAEVEVVRSDRIDVPTIAALAPHGLVVSPGPGRPEDAGVTVAAIRAFGGRIPILGVCLGHQAIGHAYGARVSRVPPVHGRPTAVHHRGDPLFAGIPSPFAACRYHSLAVESLPDVLVPLAESDGVLMAVRHRDHPVWGVQFHPESFRTAHGERLLANFLVLGELTRRAA